MNRKLYWSIPLLLLVLGGLVLLDARMAPRKPVRNVAPAMMQAATLTIGTLVVNPSVITVNTATSVLVTTQITDPNLIAGSVNLLRLGPTGATQMVLGIMHDDGLNGDLIPNDKVFSLQLTFSETATGRVQLQVSAAARGQLRRALSTIGTIEVWEKYNSSALGISFSYPTITSAPMAIVTTTPDGAIAFQIPSTTGQPLSAFYITLASSDGVTPLNTWFEQNVDTANILSLNNVYTFSTLVDGRTMLNQTGGIPNEWDGGSIAKAYIMSTNKTQVAIVQLSQDSPLPDYGFTPNSTEAFINSISQTITFQ